MKKHIIPFSNIVPVKGYKQGILCDSQRKKIEVVPNSLIDIIAEYKKNSIQEIELKFQENIDTLNEYKNYLLKNEYAFIGNDIEKELFPDKSLEWHFPSEISNSILDIKIYKEERTFEQIKQLDEINCKNIQFRFFQKIEYTKLEKLMSEVSNYSFQTIDLILDTYILSEKLDEFIETYPILGNLLLYNAPEKDTFVSETKTLVVKSTKKSINISQCGIIGNNHFVMNEEHFTESQHHNTCLNRKISIDVNGEIKNCPSMEKSFGNIKDTTLQEALEKPGFKDFWNLKKDDIDVCKDCEFRHICTDCRAFIKDENDIYSQPAKCGYNPYIAKWESQEGYITVEEWRENND